MSEIGALVIMIFLLTIAIIFGMYEIVDKLWDIECAIKKIRKEKK